MQNQSNYQKIQRRHLVDFPGLTSNRTDHAINCVLIINTIRQTPGTLYGTTDTYCIYIYIQCILRKQVMRNTHSRYPSNTRRVSTCNVFMEEKWRGTTSRRCAHHSSCEPRRILLIPNRNACLSTLERDRTLIRSN